MKKNVFLSVFIVYSCFISFAQTAAPPSHGDGSQSNPYQIATLDNLYWLSVTSSAWDKHFIQTADIDASSTSTWDDGKGFNPIGTSSITFTGSYNGHGHVVSYLTILRSGTNFVGFFGYTSNAKIDSLGLADILVKGYSSTGGLVGNADFTDITSCFVSGENISSSASVGGLAGTAFQCNISHSYSHVKTGVEFSRRVGGFIGNCEYSTISYCYSAGGLTGYSDIGGFIGYPNASNNTINHCFWDVDSTGISASFGGLGLSSLNMKDPMTFLNYCWDFEVEVINGMEDVWAHNSMENHGYPFLSWQNLTNEPVTCQAPAVSVRDIVFGNTDTSSITLASYTICSVDGFAIYINDTDEWIAPVHGEEPASNTVWQNAGQQCIYFGTSQNPIVTVTNLQSNTKYYFKIYAYNDCAGSESYEENGAFAVKATDPTYLKPLGSGTEEDPYQISNMENLAWYMVNTDQWDKHYIQTDNIDASSTKNWDSGQGFSPVGTSDVLKSTGSYNGKGHTINGLYINRPNTDNIGFFGYSHTKIDSLGLINVDITGKNNVGGLSGFFRGSANQCYVTGKINGQEQVGGFAGKINSFVNIENTYASCQVYAEGNHVGGFAGLIESATIESCFSSDTVVGSDYVGGFAGTNTHGLVLNSYSKANVSASSLAGGFIARVAQIGEVKKCYSTGAVDGSINSGGFIGSKSGTGIVDSCYWDINTSGLSTSVSGIGKISEHLQTDSTFINAEWDFMCELENGTNEVWGINPDFNGGYPFLSWQGFPNLDLIPPSPDADTLPVLKNQCSITVSSFPTATDNCAGQITASTTDPLTYSNQGTDTITWIYDDGNGNISLQKQLVIINDITAPAPIIAELPEIIGECSATISEIPLAIDNCKDTVFATTEDPLEYNMQGSYTITWTYQDGNGNNLNQEQTVTIKDISAPLPTISELPVLTDDCSVFLNEIPVAIDNCADTIIASTNDPLEYTEQGTFTITWIFDDGNGNSVNQEQTVFINDDAAPIPIQTDLPAIIEECEVIVEDIPVAIDNCNDTVKATTNDPLHYSTHGNYSISWIYDDGLGNTTTQNQIIVIEDKTSPVITCPNDKIFTLQEGQSKYTISGAELDPSNIYDNCESVSLQNSINSLATLDGEEFEPGKTIINWILRDVAGNEASCAFEVIVNSATEINNLPSNLISIYPNPAKERLNIDFNNDGIKKVTIYNLSGKAILNLEIAQRNIAIDISAYTKGIYIVKIDMENSFITRKFVKN